METLPSGEETEKVLKKVNRASTPVGKYQEMQHTSLYNGPEAEDLKG